LSWNLCMKRRNGDKSGIFQQLFFVFLVSVEKQRKKPSCNGPIIYK
jgi:hypothetical protein